MKVVLAPSVRIAQDRVGVRHCPKFLGSLGLAVSSITVRVVSQGELAVFFSNNWCVVTLGAAEDGVEVLRCGWRWRSVGWRLGSTVSHRFLQRAFQAIVRGVCHRLCSLQGESPVAYSSESVEPLSG